MDQSKITQVTSDGIHISLSDYKKLALHDQQNLAVTIKTDEHGPIKMKGFKNSAYGLDF